MDFMSAILSFAPVAVLIAALTLLHLPAWRAALLALAIGILEAAVWRGLAVKDISICLMRGTQTGLYPIGLVIIAALFTYAITVESKAIDEIKSGLSSLSSDKCFLALLIAWGFGNFMEGMAGFGTAVAIPCAILVGIGFDPMKAVLCCLVANTTPTAFGSVGVPTMVLASETGLELARLSSTISFLQLVPTALSPFLILAIAGGWRGVKANWKLALLSDIAFLVPWLAVANYMGCELPDIIGGACTMVALALSGNRSGIDWKRQAWAWRPFAVVVALLGCASIMPADLKPSSGCIIMAGAFIGGMWQGVKLIRLFSLLAATVKKYALALVTICAVLALAKVMGASGMTAKLADALVASTGRFYSAVSPVVGALAGFVTGSGTSSNVLFGSLQVSVADVETRKFLFAAANATGAGIGKMTCPQSIVPGCAAAGLSGRESSVMAKAAIYFAAVLATASAATIIMSRMQGGATPHKSNASRSIKERDALLE